MGALLDGTSCHSAAGMSEDRLERAKELGGNVAKNGWQIFKSELRFLLGSFFRPFFKALLVIGLPLTLLCVYALVSGMLKGKIPNEALNWILALPVSLAYALTVAGPAAMGVAACVSAWKLAGPWILAPLILIPLALVLAFVLMSPVIGAAGVGLGAALIEAGAEHHWMVAQLGPAARIGPPVLILALPPLILDLGAILFAEEDERLDETPTLQLDGVFEVLASTTASDEEYAKLLPKRRRLWRLRPPTQAM